jgi:hypothetical protein
VVDENYSFRKIKQVKLMFNPWYWNIRSVLVEVFLEHVLRCHQNTVASLTTLLATCRRNPVSCLSITWGKEDKNKKPWKNTKKRYRTNSMDLKRKDWTQTTASNDAIRGFLELLRSTTHCYKATLFCARTKTAAFSIRRENTISHAYCIAPATFHFLESMCGWRCSNMMLLKSIM